MVINDVDADAVVKQVSAEGGRAVAEVVAVRAARQLRPDPLRDRLSLWSHPQEIAAAYTGGGWTADAIATAWPTSVGSAWKPTASPHLSCKEHTLR